MYQFNRLYQYLIYTRVFAQQSSIIHFSLTVFRKAFFVTTKNITSWVTAGEQVTQQVHQYLKDRYNAGTEPQAQLTTDITNQLVRSFLWKFLFYLKIRNVLSIMFVFLKYRNYFGYKTVKSFSKSKQDECLVTELFFQTTWKCGLAAIGENIVFCSHYIYRISRLVFTPPPLLQKLKKLYKVLGRNYGKLPYFFDNTLPFSTLPLLPFCQNRTCILSDL